MTHRYGDAVPTISEDEPCPCGTGQTYQSCCRPVHHKGAGIGTTAESLMRARYSAYVLHDEPFLLDSWHPETRPPAMNLTDEIEWLGLTIEETTGGDGLDGSGTVEFRARFRRAGEYLELHERSAFTRVDGKWLYVDGAAP